MTETRYYFRVKKSQLSRRYIDHHRLAFIDSFLNKCLQSNVDLFAVALSNYTSRIFYYLAITEREIFLIIT